MTPKHYQAEVSPWDLQKYMFSSGNAFVDGRRCDAIKYIFRNKKSLLEDLKKAKHCLEAALERLETEPKQAGSSKGVIASLTKAEVEKLSESLSESSFGPASVMNKAFPFMCELCGAKYTEHPEKSCYDCSAPATRIKKFPA